MSSYKVAIFTSIWQFSSLKMPYCSSCRTEKVLINKEEEKKLNKPNIFRTFFQGRKKGTHLNLILDI